MAMQRDEVAMVCVYSTSSFICVEEELEGDKGEDGEGEVGEVGLGRF